MSSEFNAPPDTCFYYEGICRASRLLGKISPNQPVRVLDLGCNSGIPDITGIRQGLINSALGIEISRDAVRKGERIKRLLNIPDSELQFLSKDILTEETKNAAKEYNPNLIAGNLPYLPAQPDTPLEVSGGDDGTLLVPSVILEYARLTDALVATMNLCSLVDVRKAMAQIEDSPYDLYKVLMLKAPFGKYTQRLYEKGVFDRLRYHPYYFLDSDLKRHQVVINMIVVSTRLGLSNNHIETDQVCDMLEYFSHTGRLDGAPIDPNL